MRFFAKPAMSHLSTDEISLMDQMQKQGKEPKAIVARIQANRARMELSGPSSSTVYKFLAGQTHNRGRSETRGRDSKMPEGLVRVANAQRLKLIKEAKNQYQVTWEDVHKATKKALRARGVTRGTCMPSLDWFQRIMRKQTAVRSRPGKRRITRLTQDEQKRYSQALTWVKYPQSWWSEDIHGFLDSKCFVCCRNEKDKKLLRTTKITHHLRTPAESSREEFVLPKKNHMLLGVPSIQVTAAVGQGRVFFWHVSEKPWNGHNAAIMYHELGKALRKRCPHERQFRIVEDGDTKGFQSGKGIQAKKEERIASWKLPPRTPSWMPWDYCLWDEVEDRVLASSKATASPHSYAKSLRLTGLRLPSPLLQRTLGKMKENIKAVVTNMGKRTQLD